MIEDFAMYHIVFVMMIIMVINVKMYVAVKMDNVYRVDVHVKKDIL